MPDPVSTSLMNENRLLATLSESEQSCLRPHFERVPLPLKKVIYEPGEQIHCAFFPLDGVISTVSTSEDGATIEVGLIGREGMTGYQVLLAGGTSAYEMMVQAEGSALKVSAEALRKESRGCDGLQQGLLRYVELVMAQMSQTVVCNTLHSIEERLARWLLMCHDRLRSDDLDLTQEFIATMLGVRRAGVTVAAGALQRAGLIEHTRGHLRILDREGLEGAACECYGIITRETERILGKGGLK